MGRWLMCCLCCLLPSMAEGQLLSPGRLAAVHAELEGLRNCTACHQLGKAGVSAERCLTCHVEIDVRVEAGRGYHATVSRESCAECHQDHLGTDFRLVRFDEPSFDHSEAGYALEQSHAALECRSCHEPGLIRDPVVVSRKVDPGALARTFLGVPTECAGCHREDNPHGAQFLTRTCDDCHDVSRWEETVGFDHSGRSFPLEGLHAGVACVECHGSGPSARYSGVAAGACSDCHQDPHGNAMEGACAACHDPSGWHSLSAAGIEGTFDHSRTSFALRGAHARATCAECHRPGRPPTGELVRISYRPGTAAHAYPIPIAQNCASCHVDRHVFPDSARRWIDCADCHSEGVWAPSSFGAGRHEGSTFGLTGAHAAVPCVACHKNPAQAHTRFTLALPAATCAACHSGDDLHAGRYGDRTCEACHTTEAFDVVSFGHESVGQECVGCHAPDDPHSDQFEGRDCSACHGTEAYTIDAFDHSTTRFPLDGAHDDEECVACHTTEGAVGESLVRYRPLGTECTDCHGSAR